jgi:hypothetical protein
LRRLLGKSTLGRRRFVRHVEGSILPRRESHAIARLLEQAGRARPRATAVEDAMTMLTSRRAAFCRRVAISAVVVAWSGAALAAGISANVGGIGAKASVSGTGVSASVGGTDVGANANVGGTGVGVNAGIGGTTATASVGDSGAGVSAAANVGAAGTTGDVTADVGATGVDANLSVDGANVGATVGVDTTGATTTVAPPGGPPSVSGLAAVGANGPAVRLARRRLCPRILAAPELFDADLVILCRSVARL